MFFGNFQPRKSPIQKILSDYYKQIHYTLYKQKTALKKLKIELLFNKHVFSIYKKFLELKGHKTQDSHNASTFAQGFARYLTEWHRNPHQNIWFLTR